VLGLGATLSETGLAQQMGGALSLLLPVPLDYAWWKAIGYLR